MSSESGSVCSTGVVAAGLEPPVRLANARRDHGQRLAGYGGRMGTGSGPAESPRPKGRQRRSRCPRCQGWSRCPRRPTSRSPLSGQYRHATI